MVQHLLFANNASSRCPVAISASETTIQLQPGTGVNFPTPALGESFMVTLEDRRTGQIEICECTLHSGDMLTVIRGQEDTIAQSFAAGTTVSNRLTAATLTLLDEHHGRRGGANRRQALRAADEGWTETTTKAQADVLVGRVNVLEGEMNAVEAENVEQDTELARLDDEKVDEAPTTGLIYGRQGEAWVETVSKTTYDAGIITQDTRDDAQDAAIAAAVAAGFPEAPADGNIYGRKTATWQQTVDKVTYTAEQGAQNTAIAAKVGPDAPSDNKQYARKNAAWARSSFRRRASPRRLPTASNMCARTPPGSRSTCRLGRSSPIPRRSAQRTDSSGTNPTRATCTFGTPTPNSAQWVQVTGGVGGGGGGPAGVLISDTPPVAPLNGQLWWESDAGRLYISYADPDSTQWVQISGPLKAPQPSSVIISRQTISVSVANLETVIPSWLRLVHLPDHRPQGGGQSESLHPGVD